MYIETVYVVIAEHYIKVEVIILTRSKLTYGYEGYWFPGAGLVVLNASL